MVNKISIEFSVRDGVVIRADAWGDPVNPPVILSHGGGQTRHAWGGTAQALAERGWYAVAYDHRGHGESDWSPGGKYQLDQFADDLRQLARRLPRPPAVVGASLGGLSAMIAQGESDTKIFSSLVLVDITHRMNREGALNIMRFMGAHSGEGFENMEQVADVIAEFTGRPRKKNLAGLSKNLRLGNDGRFRWHWDPKILDMDKNSAGKSDRLLHAVQSIDLPILLVRGQLSDLVTEEIAQEFLRLVPQAKYVDVERARHMVAGDRNDIFTDAVINFLEEL
jgi:pimeloyl-ACP methyl ester carboxylesterase